MKKLLFLIPLILCFSVSAETKYIYKANSGKPIKIINKAAEIHLGDCRFTRNLPRILVNERIDYKSPLNYGQPYYTTRWLDSRSGVFKFIYFDEGFSEMEVYRDSIEFEGFKYSRGKFIEIIEVKDDINDYTEKSYEVCRKPI